MTAGTLSTGGERRATRTPEVAQKDFECFREYFYRATGIHFDDRKRSWVERSLRQRMEALGCADFLEYFHLLRFRDSGEEFNHLVSHLTVNETYFYREDYQFRCLVNSVLPELMAGKRAGEPLRVWSVPCSTGEEPYSIAIYLLEEWGGVDAVEVEIYATDIDLAAVDRVHEGVYGQYTLRNLSEAVLRRYFEPLGTDQYRVCKPLRDSLEVWPGNLLDPYLVEELPAFDVIFCRNMLIYFDERSRRRAAQNLFDALRPGGFLFLGHAESMSRISPLFSARRFPDALAYQKPGGER